MEFPHKRFILQEKEVGLLVLSRSPPNSKIVNNPRKESQDAGNSKYRETEEERRSFCMSRRL